MTLVIKVDVPKPEGLSEVHFRDPDRAAVAMFCLLEGIGRILEHEEPLPPPVLFRTPRKHGQALYDRGECGGRLVRDLHPVNFLDCVRGEDKAAVAYRGTCV